MPRILFHAGACLPIHARSLEERPLGGIETGVLKVAERLSARGHEVVVYTSHRKPPASSPQYLHHSHVLDAGSCDVLVAVKDWRGILLGLEAEKRFFLTGDSFDTFENYGMGDGRVSEKIDLFLGKSQWHCQSLSQVSGFPLEKTHSIANGVELSYFEGECERDRKILVYSSAPFRGLELAGHLFTRIQLEEPDAEFHVFSGLKIYDTDKPFSGPKKDDYDRVCRKLSSMRNCFIHGNVPQRQLAREFMRAGILFYPNTFLETSCRTAIEAQAAGCPIVTSALGALPETVDQAGLVVHGKPGSEQYNKDFVEAALKLMRDEKLWNKLSQAGKKQAAERYTWDRSADLFEEGMRKVGLEW